MARDRALVSSAESARSAGGRAGGGASERTLSFPYNGRSDFR